jgi:ferredoxin
VQVGEYEVTVDRDLCIGAATCAAIAPQTFNLDNEAKAVILESAGVEDYATVLEAAKACPVAAITLKDVNGTVVFP